MNNTRGFGLLETFLSKQRARLANSLIKSEHRTGKVLDLGCGSTPYFLSTTDFAGKYGLDPFAARLENSEINITQAAFKGGALPYADSMFSVITMLAVVEHIELNDLRLILKEAYRVLAPGGRLIMTTPSPWTDSLLKLLAKLHFLSHEEIEEHKDLLSLADLKKLTLETAFSSEQLQCGYFECGLNQYFYADKH